MAKQSISVSLLGKSYRLVCEQDVADFEQAVGTVDTLMQRMVKKDSTVPETKVALLACVQLAVDLVKTRDRLQGVEKRIERLIALLQEV